MKSDGLRVTVLSLGWQLYLSLSLPHTYWVRIFGTRLPVPSYITSTAQVQMWEQLVQLLLWELADGDGGLYLGLSLWSQSIQNQSNRMKYGASCQPHSSGYFAWLIQRPVFLKKVLVSGEIFIQQPIFPLKSTLNQSKKNYIFLCVTNNVIK